MKQYKIKSPSKCLGSINVNASFKTLLAQSLSSHQGEVLYQLLLMGERLLSRVRVFFQFADVRLFCFGDFTRERHIK